MTYVKGQDQTFQETEGIKSQGGPMKNNDEYSIQTNNRTHYCDICLKKIPFSHTWIGFFNYRPLRFGVYHFRCLLDSQFRMTVPLSEWLDFDKNDEYVYPRKD